MKNYTMKNCANIYTNNSPNESCLEHFLILNGVFELGEPTDQMLDQVCLGQLCSHNALSAPSLYMEALLRRVWTVTSMAAKAMLNSSV